MDQNQIDHAAITSFIKNFPSGVLFFALEVLAGVGFVTCVLMLAR